MDDLWPSDIGFDNLRTPILLLLEQAQYLKEKTNGLITAEVVKMISTPNNFNYTYVLFAQSINYRFRLFDIEYTIDLYPLKLIPDIDIHREFITLGLFIPNTLTKITISDENVFKTILKFLFRANKTRIVIATILRHIDLAHKDNDI